MKRMYFGHAKGTYGTQLETLTIARIKRSVLFHGDPLFVNPNDPLHEERAEGYRLGTKSDSSMPYFLDLARSCDIGVFLLMPDGRWSYGTALEAQELLRKSAPVWSIALDGTYVRVTSIRPTRIMTREETTDWNKGLRMMSKSGAI